MKEQSIACITNLHHCCEEAICGVQTHKSAQILHHCFVLYLFIPNLRQKDLQEAAAFEIQLHPHSDNALRQTVDIQLQLTLRLRSNIFKKIIQAQLQTQ